MEVDDYLEKQKSPQKEILSALRKLVLKTVPACKEKMMWGVPTFADGKFYIVSLKDHVNIGFSVAGLSKDELAMFEGSGKTMRHLEIRSLGDIDAKKLARLIKLVMEKAECKGCGKTSKAK